MIFRLLFIFLSNLNIIYFLLYFLYFFFYVFLLFLLKNNPFSPFCFLFRFHLRDGGPKKYIAFRFSHYFLAFNNDHSIKTNRILFYLKVSILIIYYFLPLFFFLFFHFNSRFVWFRWHHVQKLVSVRSQS